jgi:lipooligosaccharide transport system ATP-binding protein
VERAVGDAADEVEQVGDRVLVYGRDGDAIGQLLRASGAAHDALVTRDATLEDVILRLTGRVLVEGQR